MNILDIALNEFKELIQTIDKDELKSIVNSIDLIDNQPQSEYYYGLIKEYDNFFNSIHVNTYGLDTFVSSGHTEQLNIIKYKNNFKPVNSKLYNITEDLEVSEEMNFIHPEAA